MSPRGTALSSASSSVQDYVKTIYSHTEWQHQPMTAGQLAARLGVANSSVSEMVGKLAGLGLVDHKPYGAIRLTPAGEQLALMMVRRHRLIETFLVRDLGYSWDEVHDEAELLEHTVSELFIERLAARLGHPTADPHGDPIPGPDGAVDRPAARPLGQLAAGEAGTIVRISDADPEILRFLAAAGIGPGSGVEVLGQKPFDGPLLVKIHPGPGEERRPTLELSPAPAQAIWVGAPAR